MLATSLAPEGFLTLVPAKRAANASERATRRPTLPGL